MRIFLRTSTSGIGRILVCATYDQEQMCLFETLAKIVSLLHNLTRVIPKSSSQDISHGSDASRCARVGTMPRNKEGSK